MPAMNGPWPLAYFGQWGVGFVQLPAVHGPTRRVMRHSRRSQIQGYPRSSEIIPIGRRRTLATPTAIARRFACSRSSSTLNRDPVTSTRPTSAELGETNGSARPPNATALRAFLISLRKQRTGTLSEP